jgi:hypothetical protein
LTGFFCGEKMPKRNENELHDWIKNNLSNFFDLKHEHQVNGNRPDFIATCKESGLQFIIEVKDASIFKGSEVYDWLQQCIRYKNAFNIPVTVFPQISYKIFDEGHKIKFKHNQHQHHNFSTFLGRMGIGELVISQEKQSGIDYYCIQIYHSGFVVWSNRYYLRDGIKYNLEHYSKL